MEFAQSQISEMKSLFGVGIQSFKEGDHKFILIPNQRIPGGVDTESVDLLLCPTSWGGYNSKLFFSRQIKTSQVRNWRPTARIAERTWHSFSWNIPVGLSLVEQIMIYLKAAK